MSDTNVRWWTDAEHDPIHEAAADWFTRLQDTELPTEEALSWQEWMTVDHRHAEAFRRIAEVWQQAELIDSKGSAPTVPSSRRSHRDRAALAITAMAALLAGLVIGLSYFILHTRPDVIETGIGEARTVRLDDGSTVSLGGATAVRIRYLQHARNIELIRGEGFFSVAPDVARPFHVQVGTTQVTALGTSFDVRRHSGRVVVAVVEGRVAVASGDTSTPVALDAGEKTVAQRSTVEKPARVAATAAVAGWRYGRLSFEHERLRDVVEDVSRYSAKRIVVGSDRVGEMEITGTVLGDNVGAWITSIESALGVKAVDRGDEIVLEEDARRR